MTLVSRENLGAWLLKCNPNVWDLGRFIDDGGDEIWSWSVADNYRTELMEPGDRAVFWVSGSLTGRLARGIWAIGYLTSSARAAVDVDDLDEADDIVQPAGTDEEAEPGADDDYWLDDDQAARVRFNVEAHLPLLHDPIKASELLQVPGVRSLEVIVQPQGSNPSFIDTQQLAALLPLLPPWPDAPALADDEIVVGTGDAAFGDPYTTWVVELAAMEAVTGYYVQRGWDVTDVSFDKVGYDLSCAAPRQSPRHVEVKGVAGRKRVVLITANELRSANDDPAWELALVTRALAKPSVRIFDAGAVVRAATPYVYRADLGAAVE